MKKDKNKLGYTGLMKWTGLVKPEATIQAVLPVLWVVLPFNCVRRPPVELIKKEALLVLQKPIVNFNFSLHCLNQALWLEASTL